MLRIYDSEKSRPLQAIFGFADMRLLVGQLADDEAEDAGDGEDAEDAAGFVTDNGHAAAGAAEKREDIVGADVGLDVEGRP